MRDRLRSGLLPVLLLAGALVAFGCGGSGGGDDAVCGNGVLETGEACDGTEFGSATCLTEGFTGGNLACTATCTLDTSACTTAQPQCETPADCDATQCQTCRDGACVSTCTGSQTCEGGVCTDPTPANCGNGVIDANEQCDGNELGGQTCESQGFAGGTLGCTAACKFDTSACTEPSADCGNGVLDAGEQCDGAELGGQTCKTQGFDDGELACTAACRFDTSACTAAAKAGVGEPCTRDSECESDFCLTEVLQGFPGGYCVAPCNGDGSCDDPNGICVDVGRQYLCLGSCTPGGTDCRDAYSCEDLGDGAGACWPACTDNAQCPDTGTCNERGFCETRCTTDADCGGGFYCGAEGVCVRIDDCVSRGCNDAAGAFYCHEGSGYCFEDACAANPCAGVANATGCARYFDEYRCECAEDYIWDNATLECVVFSCNAINLGVFDGSSISRTGDSCAGTARYDAGGSGVSSCTGYTTAGNEVVYSLTLPAGEAVQVKMVPDGFDAALWVTTDCSDTNGLACVVGGDDPEIVIIENDTAADVTYYIMADAWRDCGTFTLTISDLGQCGNDILEGREQCDGADFGTSTCASFGFVEGTLSCTSECTVDTANCTYGALQPVGGPCTADADCASGMCFGELEMGLSGGYCVAECTEDGGCWDPANVCVRAGGRDFCAKSCTVATPDCHDGYECVDLGEGNGACWAKCTADSQCAVAGRCDLDTGFCTCPLGQHLDTEAVTCVYDDCDYLDCAALNRNCDPAGGCAGACAACTDCVPGTVPTADGGHCMREGAAWGGPCENDADCPGSGVPGEDTYCDKSGTGGFCLQFGGPDHVGDGAPCTGDPNSVGLTMAYAYWLIPICLQGCDTDADCRAGYACSTGMDHNGAVKACSPITECATAGCNDDGSLVCAADGQCWIHACAANPCRDMANSTGECITARDSYACECADGFRWDAEAMTCADFECPATDLGVVTENIELTAVDSCAGTALFNAGGTGRSCTGYGSRGNEMVYRITLPAGASVRIKMTPTGFDAALWVTTACNDLVGALCVVGADDPEELTLTNEGAEAATYYIVADAYRDCGTFNLLIELQ